MTPLDFAKYLYSQFYTELLQFDYSLQEEVAINLLAKKSARITATELYRATSNDYYEYVLFEIEKL